MKVQPPLLLPCILALSLANTSLAAQHPRQILTQQPQQSTDTATATLPPTTAPPATTQTPPPATTQPSAVTTTSTTPPTTTSQTPPVASGSTTDPLSGTTLPSSTGIGPPLSSGDAVTMTDAAGDAVTTTILGPSETSSTALPTNTSKPDDDGGGGLSTGSIIGMSVAAGVAVIGIVGFFVWKFTRKRFSDFDDNEAIKWPELNTHGNGNPDSHALPARDTGRSGFDTGSEADLSRVNSTSNYSTPDFGAGGPDPYAVPPLPHLNPNQPYRDDPSPATGYYDPYRGPVPGTLESGTTDWQPEAYPMTQLGGSTGRASPAPDYTYEGGRHGATPGAMYGRGSPAPQVPYGGRASPGPQGAYGGRASPGLQAAYGGRASPGPQAAYSTGPGPNTAYDGYGTR